MDGQILIQNISTSLACKIKVRMICHIGNRCFIAYTCVNNTHSILFCKFICNTDIKFSWKSVFTVRADPGKCYAVIFLIYVLCCPEFFFKTIRTAVEIIVSLVLGKNHFLSVQFKTSAFYPVSAASDACAEKASVFHISFQCIVSQNYIYQVPLTVRNADLCDHSSK